MTDNATVFLVQNPPPLLRNGVALNKDFSSAQRYGKIQIVLGDREQASLTPGKCLFKLSQALRKFNPETDYLCYAGGDPMGLALALIALKNNGVRKLFNLRWERERDTEGKRKSGGFYVPVEIELQL